MDVEQAYRVGALAGEEWETFGRVGGVAFDPSGHLYVLDSQAARIVMVVLRDGRTVAFNQGFILFGADGEFEREVRMAGDEVSQDTVA